MFPDKKFSLGRLLTGIIVLGLLTSCSGSAAPTATPMVTDEPTVLPVMPTADASVQSGTPVPAGAVISVENAASLTQVARWGQGTVKSADYSSKTGLVAVASSFGVILYNAQTLAEVRALPTNSAIRQVIFSPDGSKLAALGEDKAVWLWQVADGTLLRWVNNSASSRAAELFFSPDSSILAIPTGNTLQLRRTSDGALLRTVTHEDLVSWAAFSPDGSALVLQPALGFTEQHLPKELWKVSDATRLGVLEKSDISAYSPDGSKVAGSDGNTVTFWQVSDSKQLNTFESPGFIMHLGFSADGSTLVTTSWDKTVRLWKVSDGTLLRTLEGHTDIVNNAVYSPDGLLLASASDDKTVKLWRVSDGTLVKTLTGHTQPPFDLLFSPDGSALVSRSRGDSFLWRVSDGTLLGQLKDSSGFYFSPDSARLISSYPTVKVWQVKDGALLNSLNQYGGQLSSIAFSKNGSLLLSNSTQGVRLWRVSDGTLLQLWETPATSLALSPEGSTVAFGMNDSTIQMWRTSDKKLLQTLKGHSADIWNVAFSADGATLASVSSDGVRLWKTSDGALLHLLEKVYAFDFSPDSSTLVSASNDGVRLWRVSDGQLLQTPASRNPPSWVSFSPEGSVVASGLADAVQLWKAADGSLVSTLKSQPTAYAFSPDGSILSLGLPDGSIELRKPTDGALLRTLKGHTGILSKLSFSPDSSVLASASRDGTVRLWKVSDGSPLKMVEVTITSLAFSPDGTLLAASLEDGTIRLWGVAK